MQTYTDQVAAIKAEYGLKIAAAAATATAERDAAYVDAPFTVCDIKLRAMTLPDYCALLAAGNAHVTRVERPEGQAAGLKFWALHDGVFLWRMSVGYRPDRAARDGFVARLVRLPFAELHEGIGDYLRDTFASAPRAGSPAGEDPLKVSFAAVLTHRLATAYGWSRAEIDATPLKVIFQQLRIIRAEERLKAGKTPLPVADASNAIIAEMLRKIDALNIRAA